MEVLSSYPERVDVELRASAYTPDSQCVAAKA